MKRNLFYILIIVLLIMFCWLYFWQKNSINDDMQDKIELINAIYNEDVNYINDLLPKIKNVDFIIGASQMGIDDDSDNSASRWELTPLENACFVGNNSIIKLLVDKGANINYVDSGLNTPINWLIYSKNDSNKSKNIKLLIDKGAKINIKDSDGNTPLILATMNNDVSTVKILLKKGANKSLMNYQKKMAIDYARENENEELIDLLN